MIRKLPLMLLLLGILFNSTAVMAGTTEMVSLTSTGALGNNISRTSFLSADGRFVAFESWATNLVDGDTNSLIDVFVFDRQKKTIERVNITNSGAQALGGNSFPSSISGDGRFVAFESSASNLVDGDTNGQQDVFVYDRQKKTVERVNVSSSGEQANNSAANAKISADGRFVTFSSSATNLVSGVSTGQLHVYVHDRLNKTTELASKSSAGIPGNERSWAKDISADGRFIVFESLANNLVAGDTNNYRDIYLHDRQTRITERINVSTDGTQGTSGTWGSISSDGRFVAFQGCGLNGDQYCYVYVRDRLLASTQAIMGAGQAPQISADGRFVVCVREVGGYSNQIYLIDRTTGYSELASVNNGGSIANSASSTPFISADGSVVSFNTGASNLVPGDTNAVSDVFVRDVSTINITSALFDYLNDELSIEATSHNGANDNLLVDGFGAMVWNAGTGTWQYKAQNVEIAPTSVKIVGNSGSKIIQ